MLRTAFDDVEDPVQRALFALSRHVRTHILSVNFWGLGHDAEALGFVFVDVFLRAGVDEIQLEVGWGLVGGTGVAVGEEPGVDIVCAEVLDVAEGSWEGGEV